MNVRSIFRVCEKLLLTVSHLFVSVSVRPSVRMENPVYRWTFFVIFISTVCQENPGLFKIRKNGRNFYLKTGVKFLKTTRSLFLG